MKKRIVIPSYQDRQATNGWEKKYQKSSDYDVIVYEKDDSLPAETEVETFEGFRISTDSSNARSSYVFLYHICKFYEDLADVEIFTKTHMHVQKVRVHESIEESHNYDFFEFWNDLRLFVWVDQKKYEELLPRWESNGWDGEWAKISGSPITELIDEKIQSQVDLAYEAKEKILVKPNRGINTRVFWPGMLEIFPNYDLPSFLVLRNENIWSVKKEVIRYHPKSFYESMLENVLKNDFWNDVGHDDWSIFWSIFWRETIRKMKEDIS